MTSQDDDERRSDRSDSAGSEPASGSYEAPPIEQSGTPTDYPPAYNPPPSYPAPTDYPPPPPGYGAPYPDPNAGGTYPGQGYGAAGPAYPPPPQYGTAPGGYPPPPMGYPGADYGYGPPAPQGTNTMAIASLVASILGVCCGIGSIVGIVLGILAINQIKETRQAGHGLAVAGIAVGAVTLVINVVVGITALNV
ncbi:DUF4190 domain-containing protein [Mycobacterium sp. PSTR-4-N]|uniref:DUF4190 domain-containing protein n=1 Tax=Mycobacterium sp. PSTR-4-N TaxID=2917745 RepID=UPI001F156175|nr:DUF4190 domain-containing protein [Mycobacterium sp. PSTR-4-N]MCG7597019.1 DUF4190 domain-containing protein [Mycobacterium sp. PSTR-4-N]